MCKKYKPPRAHHCRQCNRSVPQLTHGAVCSSALRRCVLKMGILITMTTRVFWRLITLLIDHHCPWINNCVGHFNHGHFIRFLFFVDVACSYHIAMVTMRVLNLNKGGYWVWSNIFLFRGQKIDQNAGWTFNFGVRHDNTQLCCLYTGSTCCWSL